MNCVFCNRDVSITTKHHLIPKTTHSKKKIRKRFSKDQRQETIDVCCDCHKTFHKFFTEMELATKYNTLKLLIDARQLSKYRNWIVKQRENIV